jgi:hypothetical protein
VLARGGAGVGNASAGSDGGPKELVLSERRYNVVKVILACQLFEFVVECRLCRHLNEHNGRG